MQARSFVIVASQYKMHEGAFDVHTFCGASRHHTSIPYMRARLCRNLRQISAQSPRRMQH